MTAQVREYMVLEVEHLTGRTTVGEAVQRLMKCRHHGFPVTTSDGTLIGFVSAKELLRNIREADKPLAEVIRPGTYTATPEMAIDDVARVMFRFGLRDLPIVDDHGKLCGILSNLDIVRSHFERASPAKAETLRALLSERYGTSFTSRRGLVPLDRLHPTQWKVFEDELEGRRYELERGFAEPVLVIEKGGRYLLVDGHHRALAAREMGLAQLHAYILTPDYPEAFDQTEIGLEKVAREHHLVSLDDIEIDRSAHHPLLEVTTQLLRRFEPPEGPKGASDP